MRRRDHALDGATCEYDGSICAAAMRAGATKVLINVSIYLSIACSVILASCGR